MEMKGNSAIIMTDTGEFLRVKKPDNGAVLGEEITSTVKENYVHRFRYFAAAAAVILLLLPLMYIRDAMVAVAYVNIDINPSLEVAVNKHNRVTQAAALDEEGKALLEKISLKNMKVEEAVGAIIEEAADMGYIDEHKQNNVNITLVKVKEEKVKISEEKLLECAEKTLKNSKIDASLEVKSTDKSARDAAKKENMSTSQYLKNHEEKNNKSLKADVKKSDEKANEKKDKKDKKDREKDKENKGLKDKDLPNVPGLNKEKNDQQKKNSSNQGKMENKKGFSSRGKNYRNYNKGNSGKGAFFKNKE